MYKPVLIASLLLLAACDQAEQTIEPTEVLRPVKFIVVGSPGSERQYIYSGSLRASSELNSSFKVNGTVQSIPVKVGDKLKSGGTIATLDKTTYELLVARARATLAQSQATKRNADTKYQRTKELYENNNSSKDALESARANAGTALAAVDTAKKSLELSELDLTYTELKSTEACDVARVLVEVNENVSAGAPIAVLSCGEVNEVTVSLPENIIASIKKDMVATVNLDAINEISFSARVTEVSVTSNNATYPVTLVLNESHPKLRSGLAAEVAFQFGGNTDSQTQLYLPAVAVNEDSEGRFVFILEPGNAENIAIVKRRPVQIGELTSLGMEITSGVEVGNKVVTAGISVIRDGLRVKAQ
ncbi:MAG: efflux RND transporter periplasmic adaptor subunit [Gammaproteobacteria bacterium]|nr:efflux RND transporter periplasmic adaptor subunit [Gammaproteobacteria bacterium]